jgi:hypothetical protein
MNLNSVTKNDLLQIVNNQEKRIVRLEAMLQGQPIGTARIADAAITTAKIVSLSVSKLTSGQLAVGTNVDIGDVSSGDYIREDGTNIRITMFKDDVCQFLFGEPD